MYDSHGYGGHYNGGGSTSTSTTTHSAAPKVVIDDMVYQKIMYWVNKSDVECSGLGLVKRMGDTIHVIEAYLLPQKNSGTATDIEPEDVGKFMFELHKKCQEEGVELDGDLRFWWHSHVNMGVFWSGTDVDTMKKVCQGGWFVNTVFNKRRELRTAISMNEPFPAIIDNIETTIQRSLDGNVVKVWDDEFTENITNRVPKHQPWSSSSPRGTTAAQERVNSQVRQIWPRDEREDSRYGGAASTQTSSTSQGEHSRTESDTVGRSPSLLSNSGYQTPHDLLNKRDQLERKLSAIETQEENLKAKKKPIPGGMIAAKARYQNQLDELESDLDLLEQYGMISNEERFGKLPTTEALPEGGGVE